MRTPSINTEMTIPSSTKGMAVPVMPMAPPITITVTKVAGTAQTALPEMLCRPDTYRHHSQEMVQTTNGMSNSIQ